MQLFGSCLGFAVLKKNLSPPEGLEFTPAASATKNGDIYVEPSNTTTSGKATDMIAVICTFPRLPCPSTERHVILNLTSAAAAAAAAAATALRTAG